MLTPPRSEPPDASGRGEPHRIGGRYDVEEEVGRGGMGAVFRVLDAHTGQHLALKRLRVQGRKDSQALALFEREFHTLAQLRHPRIITVHDYGVDAAGAYYTMELLPGADMRKLAPLPWPLVCTHLREIATSLALLHARKLVHRDVTPQNVRVGHDGHCKLIDFGALADSGSSGEVVGTPPCLPPEAIEGRPIDQRLDLYALGCLGYWMLTGRHAYPATDINQLRAFWTRTVPAPSLERPLHDRAGTELPEIPAALDKLVMALIALDPMARPSSAGAVIDQLDVIARRQKELSSVPPEDVSLVDSYLESAPLCGRESELKQVRLALDRGWRGRGGSVIVEGEAGVGRSHFLAEVALRCKLAGFTTLSLDAAAHTQELGSARALLLQLTAKPTDNTANQSQLLALVQAAVQTRPVALVIDDAHRMDESSLRLLTALAHDARRSPLVIVSAVRTNDEALCDSGLSGLRQLSTRLELADLGEKHVFEWLSSVLGDAPNLGRLASFLHQRTRGRAASIAMMLRLLIDRGHVRYREGFWVLPPEPAQITLPERDHESAFERLNDVPEGARKLAEVLSVYRGACSPALCTALVGPGALLAIEQLTGAGLWLPGEEGYRFASEALREHVLANLPTGCTTALHSRVAVALLGRATDEQRAPTMHEKLAASVHMLEAKDRRGVPIAVQAAIEIWEDARSIAGAVRLLERALVLCRPLGITATGKLALLAPLGLAAYMADRRLSRHEAELFETLDAVSGLDVARRLERVLGRLGPLFARLGALLGLAFGAVRYYTRPRAGAPDHPRPVGFRTAARLGVSALIGLAGRAAICLDTPAVKRVVQQIWPLRALGRKDSGYFSVAYCEGLLLSGEDNCHLTYEHWLSLERMLSRPGSFPEIRGEHRAHAVGGVSYVLGLFEGFRGDARALGRAEELERGDNGMHHMIAAQIRLQYHAFRGEAELVRKAFERMEACAIEVGSSWQVETWSAITINLFGQFWQDIIIAKRGLREAQRMAPELPTLKRYADAAEAVYLMRRGQPRESADLYEQMLAEEQPSSRIGWAASSGLLAEAYNMLGKHQEARAVCERVMATVDPRDRPYYAVRIALELPYAVALSALGEYPKARAHLLELLECYAVHASPAALGSVYEALAHIEYTRFMQGTGDRKLFTAALKQVEKYFPKLGNPAFIARFQALTDLAAHGGELSFQIAHNREVRAFEQALEPVMDRAEGARSILAWMMRSCAGYEGYLFVRPLAVGRDESALGQGRLAFDPVRSNDPVLIAATTDREPGDETFALVADALKKLGGDGDTTNAGTNAASSTRRDGNSAHLFLLSHLDADEFCAEGALVLLGRASAAPPVRYELLRAAALQLRRLSGTR